MLANMLKRILGRKINDGPSTKLNTERKLYTPSQTSVVIFLSADRLRSRQRRRTSGSTRSQLRAKIQHHQHWKCITISASEVALFSYSISDEELTNKGRK